MNTHSSSGRVQFNEVKLEKNQRSSHGTTQTQVELMGGGGGRSEWAGQSFSVDDNFLLPFNDTENISIKIRPTNRPRH